jgi:cytoskeletal protein RodZ
MAEDPGIASLGSYLRKLRLARNGSLEDMARSTRITERHLKALESDDRSELPAPVFVKGFIRAYCDFLGESADEALGLYRELLGTQPISEARPVSARGSASWMGHPIVVSGVLLLVFGVGLLALNRGVRGGSERALEPAATAQHAEPAAPPSPPAEMASVSEPDSSAAQRLVVKAVEATWIRVQTDDGRVAEELLLPGTTREWTSDKHFLLTVGNAGGVELELNGRPLPSLGARGAVIHRLSLPEPPAGS